VHPHLRNELAHADRQARLRKAADEQLVESITPQRAFLRLLRSLRRRSTSSISTLDPRAEIRIRPASTEEATALRQLSTVHGASTATGALLMADVDGSAEAALSLEAGLIIAITNPPSPEVHELLRLRAQQLVQVGTRDHTRSSNVSRPERRFTRSGPRHGAGDL
jgi:hypothetical protein